MVLAVLNPFLAPFFFAALALFEATTFEDWGGECGCEGTSGGRDGGEEGLAGE